MQSVRGGFPQTYRDLGCALNRRVPGEVRTCSRPSRHDSCRRCSRSVDRLAPITTLAEPPALPPVLSALVSSSLVSSRATVAPAALWKSWFIVRVHLVHSSLWPRPVHRNLIWIRGDCVTAAVRIRVVVISQFSCRAPMATWM